MHDDMVFSFIFQMKNGCFRCAVALVAIVLCLEIVQGNENSLADQGRTAKFSLDELLYVIQAFLFLCLRQSINLS